MNQKVVSRLLAMFITAILFFMVLPSSAAPQEELAPLIQGDRTLVIPDHYIIVFKPGASLQGTQSATEQVAAFGGKIKHSYGNALNGFSAEMSAKAVAALQKNPNIAYIEVDQLVQVKETWGLDRVDQQYLPLNDSYSPGADGTGVDAYIIDTGIRTTHNEFGGRALEGYSAISGGAQDCNGHGTHVAGTVGGSNYGIAKNVTLYAVRVLDCNGSGSNSGVIAGVDWVASHHTNRPAVANMSLGGGASTALDNAVQNAINDGVTFVVAAGNESANACNGSPARVNDAVTVGATDSSDVGAYFTNYGNCVDIFAPGVNISSAWYSNNSATNTISGTSMAAPHVAGVAALYLQANSSASPATVFNSLLSSATPNILSSIGSGSPNLMLFWDGGAGTPPPPPPPPPPADPTCAGTLLAGTLTGTGDSVSYYLDAYRGGQTGELTGPSNADFDLHLYKWNSRRGWVQVGSSESGSSNELIDYSSNKTADYKWSVSSYSGSGDYQFCFSTN